MAGGNYMNIIVDRTVSQIQSNEDGYISQEHHSLSDFDSEQGYVLLGEPGMGKTTEFSEEATRVDGLFIPVRRFINRDIENHPEWRNKLLFLDGLDEARAGGGDPREVIDKVVSQLEILDPPKFRLSCRSGSWLRINDLNELSSLLVADTIPVLQLNPLNYDDISKIVSHHREDARDFIQEVRQYGMEAFLWNPQLLTLLLKSVETRGWPDSPTMVFEEACKELVTERNREHGASHSFDSLPNHNSVLSAAGQLSALMLIANKAGWSVDYTDDPEILSLRDVEETDRDVLRAALDSKVFEGNLSRRVPLHRLLTEYLGARYLHKKIQDGLSVQRVFAFLLGYDGTLLPDLRGLAAWLAALNHKARSALIHADPVAVAFNGDASSFGLEERQELLNNLEQSIDLTYTWPSAAALGALVGNQGTSLVWELTGLPVRSDNRQMLVYQLLRGVSQRYSGMGLDKRLVPDVQPEISRKNLLNIVYDPSWQEDVRCEALRTLNLILVGKSNRKTTFGKLLSDLQRDLLPDENNDLRGTILDLLYPTELSPSELWAYLVERAVAYRHNIYLEFWDRLIDRARANEIRELLDSLCDLASEVIPKLANHRLTSIVPGLLARGLDLFGDELDISDLYRWFKLVESDVQTSQLVSIDSSDRPDKRNDEANTVIRNWLSKRETIQRALIEHDLVTQESKISSNRTIGLKFVGTNTPVGFRSWCLARATELSDAHPIAAERLAWWSVWMEAGWEDPLSDEKVGQMVSYIPSLREWNRKRLSGRDRAEQEKAEWSNKLAKIRAANRIRRQKDLDPIRQQKTELAKGKCSPELLHRLATIYFNGLATRGKDPNSQLMAYLEGDMSLVQAALAGFRSMLDRDELPDLDQIAQLHENDKMSYFTLPFLAGMEEENDSIIDSLSERGRRRVLGFYLVTDRPMVPATPRGENLPNLFTFYENYHPIWYENALKYYPEAVADSLVAIHNACVRAKLSPNRYLYEMAYNRAYFRVAQLAVTRMFSVFPTKCNERQLESLRVVLWSAILARGMSSEELREIVLMRLQRKNMDIAQRAQWLSAGVYAARDQCIPLLEEFISAGEESRIHHVLSFLVPDRGKLILRNVKDWRSEEISLLIRALGRRVQRPDFQEGAHILSNEEINRNKFGSLLVPWLQELIIRSDTDTIDALDSLATDPDLAAWTREIVRAQEEQGQRRRAANRPDLNPEQVQKTLQGGPPASAADLAALTFEVLDELADRIRTGQTNDWRQYWYWDHKTKKPTRTKDEDDCRDILLSDLKAILHQHGIDAQPEGRYADEKRADIRVSYKSNFSIPIEIKKNSHRKIWHGISEQLVPKYTRDPNSDGHGIYLVLWFGSDRKYMKMLPSSGGIPKKPKELKKMLEEQLDPALKKRINVVVIDVSLSDKFIKGENIGSPLGPGLLSSFKNIHAFFP